MPKEYCARPFFDKAVRPMVNRVGRSWARHALIGLLLLIPEAIALVLSGLVYFAHIRSWIEAMTGS